MFEALDDKDGIGRTLANVGLIYYEEGNLTQALTNCLQGFRL
jgi:hypothetical protein